MRYSPPRTTVRVRTELTATHDRIELTVTDRGAGVPANQLQTLGSRFYRALGSGQSGSGLGLSIVKRIAELHAAAVRFEGGTKRRRAARDRSVRDLRKGQLGASGLANGIRPLANRRLPDGFGTAYALDYLLSRVNSSWKVRRQRVVTREPCGF